MRRDDITISNLDALDFLKAGGKEWPEKTLIYLDPPYYNKGQCLYRNSYDANDHSQIATYLRRLKRKRWLASYDNAPEIQALYVGLKQQTYSIDYTARSRAIGSEIVIFGSALSCPYVVNPMKVSKRELFAAAA